MWIWSFEIETTDEPSDVRERILALLRVEKPTTHSMQLCGIRGTVSRFEFEIRRNHLFNAIRWPVIAQGHVAPTNYGSVVDVNTKPDFRSLVCFGVFSTAIPALLLIAVLIWGHGGPLCCTVPVFGGCGIFIWLCMFASWAKDASLLQDELANVVRGSASHSEETWNSTTSSMT